MNRILLWKEYREQQAAWLVFAFLGIVTSLVATVLPEANALDWVIPVQGLLVGSYGVICGAILLAGETEEHTQLLLDRLPVSRHTLWIGKLLAGVALVLMLAVFVALTLLAVPGLPLALLGVLPVVALLGLFWGMWGGAFASTVLGGIANALLFVLGAVPLWGFLIFVGLRIVGMDSAWAQTTILPVVVALLYFVPPLISSHRRYCQPDIERIASMGPEDRMHASVNGWLVEDLRLIWRLSWPLLTTLLALALPLGYLCTINNLMTWPICTALLGILVGVSLFRGEQSGALQFWADQRLPVTNLWTSRVLFAGFFMVVVICMMCIPAWNVVNHSRVALDDTPFGVVGNRLLFTQIPLATWVLLWPVSGFAGGLLAGMLFRKPIVAGVVALGVTLLLVAPWVPSLVTGELTWWVAVAPSVVLIVALRFMTHRWATRQSLARPLMFTGLLLLGVTALGLVSRFALLKEIPEPARLRDFLSQLPAKPTEGTELIRQGCEQARSRHRKPASHEWRDHPERSYLADLAKNLHKPWPETEGLDAWWREEIYDPDWYALMGRAPQHPVGILIDPRYVPVHLAIPSVEGSDVAALLLAAEALRMQRRANDPSVFVRHLEICLYAARTFDTGSTWQGQLAASRFESVILTAVEGWLARLEGRVDLLERVQTLLDAHPGAPDPESVRLAGYTTIQRVFESPQYAGMPPITFALQPEEQAWISTSLLLPWERERLNRQWRSYFFDDKRLPAQLPSVGGFYPVHDVSFYRRRQLRLDIARLQIALRRFEEEKGKPALSLDDLGRPVPRDPFGTGPLRYRLEEGRGLLWSVGDDGRDAEGRPGERQERFIAPPGEDLAFPVPPRFRPKK